MAEDHFVRRLTIYSVMPALQIPLGVWLLASPYFLQYTQFNDARMIAAALGPFITGFAITRLAVTPPWFWTGWVNVVLGAIVLVTPFLLGLTDIMDLTINFVVVGALVVITAVVGQMEKAEIDETFPGKTH